MTIHFVTLMIQVFAKKGTNLTILLWEWDVSTINPTRSGGVWMLRGSGSAFLWGKIERSKGIYPINTHYTRCINGVDCSPHPTNTTIFPVIFGENWKNPTNQPTDQPTSEPAPERWIWVWPFDPEHWSCVGVRWDVEGFGGGASGGWKPQEMSHQWGLGQYTPKV